MSKKFLQIIVFVGMSVIGLEAANAESPCLGGEAMLHNAHDQIKENTIKMCERVFECRKKGGNCRTMQIRKQTTDRGDITGFITACCLAEKK